MRRYIAELSRQDAVVQARESVWFHLLKRVKTRCWKVDERALTISLLVRSIELLLFSAVGTAGEGGGEIDSCVRVSELLARCSPNGHCLKR